MWMIGAPFATGYSCTMANDGDDTSRGAAPSSVAMARARKVFPAQAIAVDVDDRRAVRDRVLMHDGERRRRHLARIGAKLRGDGAREKGLPRAEVADEMYDGVARQRAGDLAAGRGRRSFVGAEVRRHRSF